MVCIFILREECVASACGDANGWREECSAVDDARVVSKPRSSKRAAVDDSSVGADVVVAVGKIASKRASVDKGVAVITAVVVNTASKRAFRDEVVVIQIPIKRAAKDVGIVIKIPIKRAAVDEAAITRTTSRECAAVDVGIVVNTPSKRSAVDGVHIVVNIASKRAAVDGEKVANHPSKRAAVDDAVVLNIVYIASSSCTRSDIYTIRIV